MIAAVEEAIASSWRTPNVALEFFQLKGEHFYTCGRIGCEDEVESCRVARSARLPQKRELCSLSGVIDSRVYASFEWSA